MSANPTDPESSEDDDDATHSGSRALSVDAQRLLCIIGRSGGWLPEELIDRTGFAVPQFFKAIVQLKLRRLVRSDEYDRISQI